jgi:hypothetical protein
MAQRKKYKITFSKTIDTIGSGVISDELDSIIEVKLPKSLSHAASDSFSGCTSLETIVITNAFKKKSGNDYIDATVNGNKVRFEGL